MLIKLEHAFIESEEKLNHPFSVIDKTKLAEAIESNSEKIRTVMLAQEQEGKKWKPTVIELRKIGTRLFTLANDIADDDIPSSVKQLLSTISPIRIDVMTILEAANHTNVTHMKAGASL